MFFLGGLFGARKAKKEARRIREMLDQLLARQEKAEKSRDLRDSGFLNTQGAGSAPGQGSGQDILSRTALNVGPRAAPSPFARPGAENLDLTGLLTQMQRQSVEPISQVPPGQQVPGDASLGMPGTPPGLQELMQTAGGQPRGAVMPGQNQPNSQRDLLRQLLQMQGR